MITLQILTFSTWHTVHLTNPSLTLELTGVLFNEDKGGTYTYPFTIDVDENINVFGSCAEVYGDSLYTILHDAKARVVANGIPILQGKVDLDKSVDIKLNSDTGHRNIEIKVVSRNKSYEDKIDGVRLRDLNVRGDNIQIGYCLPKNLPFQVTYTKKVYNTDKNSKTSIKVNGTTWDVVLESSETKTVTASVTLPHYLFAKLSSVYGESGDPNHDSGYYQGGSLYLNYGTFDFTNVQNPYNPNDPLANPFCNVRVCYKKYSKDSSGNWKNEERGYNVGQPDRINSAPCFYVGYVFDLAMREIGMPVTSNALNSIMDYKRMAFYHADAQYDETEAPDAYGNYLSSTSTTQENRCCIGGYFNIKTKYQAGQQYDGNQCVWSPVQSDGKRRIIKCDFSGKWIRPMYHLNNAFANADNLPDIEVKELIEDITTPFAGKVIYDEFTESIKIILMRDVMSAVSSSVDVPCEVISEPVKTENNIRGFRLKYAGSNSLSYNTVTKVKNESEGSDATAYNYHGYKNIQLLKAGNSFSNYIQLAMGVNCFDENVYIDTNTSNMYRIKVDDSAATQGEWFPSVFEVAGYRDVEIGDCSDDDYVEQVSIPFAPAMATISNPSRILVKSMSSGEIESPIYAQYLEGEIHYRGSKSFVETEYRYDNIPLEQLVNGFGEYVSALHVDVGVWINATEGYSNNSSESPYYDNECDNTIGIMRSSGSSAGIAIYDDNFDGQGTSRYTETAGSDAEFFSDSVNHFGQKFDYNGDTDKLTITVSNAPSLISQYFPNSNANLLASTRAVSGSAMIEKGWTDVSSSDTCTVYSMTYEFGGYYYLMTPIKDDGTILSSDEMSAYVQTLSSKDVMSYDRSNNNIIIGRYSSVDEADRYAIFLHNIHEVYYVSNVNSEVDLPISNGIGYDFKDAISLKLKAEKPKDGDETKGKYYECSADYAKRGLYDKFYADWAQFLINHKVINLPLRMELAAFQQLVYDTTQWYTFGDYTGLIKNGTATINDDGTVSLDLKLAYL